MSSRATDDPGPPPTPRTSRRKQVIATLVTLVVLVIVFAGILPKFGNQTQMRKHIGIALSYSISNGKCCNSFAIAR
jgi:hypothetical protein